MFSVNFGKNNSTTAAHDVLTDICLERGAYSGCIRYTVSISIMDYTIIVIVMLIVILF
jgi:hypothetical protein